MKINTHQEVATKYESYPESVRDKMFFLRDLILKTAEEMPEIDVLEEALKWGEPSFLTQVGSTLRIDWKENTPHQYQMYFQCQSRLVETFKLVFGDVFEYDKSRAIIFQLDQDIPIQELKQCIEATLTYHKVKHLDFLGIVDLKK